MPLSCLPGFPLPQTSTAGTPGQAGSKGLCQKTELSLPAWEAVTFPSKQKQNPTNSRKFQNRDGKTPEHRWERKSPFQIDTGSFSALIPKCFSPKITIFFLFFYPRGKSVTPPKPHVAQGYCQPSWLRKQDRDDPLLPWQHSLLPQAAFCPSRSVPSSHNPCFFCWPAERSLPSWKRARRPGPPQLMQYLLLQSRAGAAENGLLCAGQLWEGGGSRGPLLLRASGVKPKLPRHSGSSDRSWTWAVGRAHESGSVSKGLSTGLQGHLGTRGQSRGVGQLSFSPATTAAQILSSWKMVITSGKVAGVCRILICRSEEPWHVPCWGAW